MKRPALEMINPSFGSSFAVLRFNENENRNKSFWHYHPEIELVYVNGGSGKRQIGSHLSYYNNGDLILIGAYLPHCGFTDQHTGNKNETVIQFLPDFLGGELLDKPEMRKIKMLFDRSKSGIAFGRKTRKALGNKIEALPFLSGFDRLMAVLSILHELEGAADAQLLNADGFSMQADMQDNERINMIFNHVCNHFQENLRLEDIAAMAGMTIPSFCRYFKKITGKTFTHFVNEYRLVHASKLLAENPMSITEICYDSGFNNFSHFNKEFKKFSGTSPSEYRNGFKTLLSNDQDDPEQYP